MLPYLSDRSPSFAFMVHYRDDADLDRLGCARFIRDHSSSPQEFRSKMCSLPPLVAGEVTFGFETLRGEILVLPRMPKDFLGIQAAALVIEGLQVAHARGVRVLGLGALTAPAVSGGTRLLPSAPPGLLVTNGNALTAAVVAAEVLGALATRGNSSSMVAMLGCTGSVGAVASRLLAAEGYPLLLVGRSADHVRKRLPDIAGRHAVASELEDVADADVIACMTSSETARLAPGLLRRGSLVLDYAQPANVERSRYAAFAAAGITVVQAGLVNVPRYHCSVDLGLPEGATFACLAETYLYVREGYTTHSVGTPSIEQAQQLWRVARRRGISPIPFVSPPPPTTAAKAAAHP